jgi:hypothetical protein
LKQVEQKLPQTFQAIGKNPYTVDMNRILAFIEEKGATTFSEIRARFYHAATPSMLTELVNGLADMGMIGSKEGKIMLKAAVQSESNQTPHPPNSSENGQQQSPMPFP